MARLARNSAIRSTIRQSIPFCGTRSFPICLRASQVRNALRPFDWRVSRPKLVHADRLSDPLAENDVYEQEQPGLW
jgi:hypothetical protein